MLTVGQLAARFNLSCTALLYYESLGIEAVEIAEIRSWSRSEI